MLQNNTGNKAVHFFRRKLVLFRNQNVESKTILAQLLSDYDQEVQPYLALRKYIRFPAESEWKYEIKSDSS